MPRGERVYAFTGNTLAADRSLLWYFRGHIMDELPAILVTDEAPWLTCIKNRYAFK